MRLASSSAASFPALLAMVLTHNGKPAGLHRTFLTAAGGKADVPATRKLLGTLPAGAAVRLADHESLLGIAEGIETALSASMLFNVPCWSADMFPEGLYRFTQVVHDSKARRAFPYSSLGHHAERWRSMSTTPTARQRP